MNTLDELFHVLRVVLLTLFTLGWLYIIGTLVWLFIRACITALKAARAGKDKAS